MKKFIDLYSPSKVLGSGSAAELNSLVLVMVDQLIGLVALAWLGIRANSTTAPSPGPGGRAPSPPLPLPAGATCTAT